MKKGLADLLVHPPRILDPSFGKLNQVFTASLNLFSLVPLEGEDWNEADTEETGKEPLVTIQNSSSPSTFFLKKGPEDKDVVGSGTRFLINQLRPVLTLGGVAIHGDNWRVCDS